MEAQRHRPRSHRSVGEGMAAESDFDVALPPDTVDALPGPIPTLFPIGMVEDCHSSSAVVDEETHEHPGSLTEIQRSCVEILETLVLDGTTRHLPESRRKLVVALSELPEFSYELENRDSDILVKTDGLRDTDGALSELVSNLAAVKAQIACREPNRLGSEEQTSIGSNSLDSTASQAEMATCRDEIAWARLDSLLSAVTRLVRGCEQTIGSSTERSLPPAYHTNPPNSAEAMDFPAPPRYTASCEHDERASEGEKYCCDALGDTKQHASPTPVRKLSPLLQDLDAVTSAIERMNTVSPQYDQQRAALRSRSTRHQDPRMRELEDIWDRIEAAHGPWRYRGVEGDSYARERRQLQRLRDTDAEIKSSAGADLANDLHEPGEFPQDNMHARMASQDDPSSAEALGTDFLSREQEGLVRWQDFLAQNKPGPRASGESSSRPTLDSSAPISPPAVSQNGAQTASPAQSPSRATGVVKKLGYICEHQENLNKISVMIYGAEQCPSLRLEVTRSNEAILSSTSDSSLVIDIALPSPVPLNQEVPLLPADGFLETRLATLPTPSSALTLNSTITYALSAPHLRELASKRICCASCDRTLANLPAAVEFKDLPSEHWAEMLEAWMCHTDPAFTAHIAKQTQDGFWPSKDTVLVGGSYLLVAGEDISDASLQHSSTPTVSLPSILLGKKESHRPFPWAFPQALASLWIWLIQVPHSNTQSQCSDVTIPRLLELRSEAYCRIYITRRLFTLTLQADEWSAVLCQCSKVLGKRKLSGTGAGTMRFSKWAISLSPSINRDSNLVRFPVSVFVVSDMLELSQAHASHRFVISDETTNEPRLALWLFNPSMRVSYRKPQAGLTEGAETSLRAAKIMYQVLGDSGYEHLPGFAGQVEQMSYPSDACTGLQSALEDSTSVYPPSRRKFGVFDCGFLERL